MPTVDSWDTISKAAASIHLNHLPWKQSFLLLSHFHTYIFFFFFFKVEGILENRGPAVFPSCPITDDFPTLIQSSANTRVNGCPLTPQCTSFAIHGTTHQLLSSGCLKVTAVRLRKKISPVSSSLWVLVTPHW